MEAYTGSSENYMYYNVLREKMKVLDLELRKVGNSYGFVIPSNIVKAEKLVPGKHVKILLIGNKGKIPAQVFGAWKEQKIDLDKAMEEINSGWRK